MEVPMPNVNCIKIPFWNPEKFIKAINLFLRISEFTFDLKFLIKNVLRGSFFHFDMNRTCKNYLNNRNFLQNFPTNKVQSQDHQKNFHFATSKFSFHYFCTLLHVTIKYMYKKILIEKEDHTKKIYKKM